MMIVILLMTAAAVSCSNVHEDPMLQMPVGGMPHDMEFCNQGRIKKLCHKTTGLFQPKPVQRPVALTFCPGTLKKLCPIKPVALKFSSGKVTSIPVGWKICRDNLGLCPVIGSRRRPAISRPSFSFDSSRFGRPGSKIPHSGSGFIENRVASHNRGMVPCKNRRGMCAPEREIVFPEARPMSHNKGMVPCKDRMGMCPPDN